MIQCTCCTPAHSFSYPKTLYKHQRKYDPQYVDPRERETIKRREAYEAAPKTCQGCGVVLAYEDVVSGRQDKYCSRSCSAKTNNADKPKRQRNTEKSRLTCLVCDKPRSKNVGKYCSNVCLGEYRYYTIHVPEIERGEKNNPLILKKYLERSRGRHCSDCLNDTWKGEPIPLELDHVDGNASNNFPDNLRLLCPNCHAMTPTAKGKNRGNGRWARRQRYAEGKSS